MKFIDLRFLQDCSDIEVDLCIVGTGPAGFSIASEFIGTNKAVLLVESGGFGDEAETQALYDIESTGQVRTINQNLIRRRILGGSSFVWSGRCAPFDPIDFEKRPWVPFSGGWPFSSRDDLGPLLNRSAKYLGLGPYEYNETLWDKFKTSPPQPSLKDSDFSPMFWQFSRSSRNPKMSTDFARDRLGVDAPNIDVLLHANLTHINTDAGGTKFRSVEVRSIDGKYLTIKSKAVALCCGGIENARVLLASNRAMQNGLGNQNDLVGRFLMDHIDCPIGKYSHSSSKRIRSRFGHYWLDDDEGRHVYEHGLALSREAQHRYQLLNCHAVALSFEQVADDPWEAIKRIRRSRKPNKAVLDDLMTTLKGSGEIAEGFGRRYLMGRPQLQRYQRNELHLVLEQAPNPNSRVTLSRDRRDALGMPISNVHWIVGDQERQTAARAADLLLQQLPKLGLHIPERLVNPAEDCDWILRCAEKAHPTGTTRIAKNPKDGVVDENCQVHGIEGLFVAGSSVFPTAGAANPTLMIVAMSLRLADHLKMRFLRHPTEVRSATLINARMSSANHKVSKDNRFKIGLIGAGNRTSDFYVPILRKMSDRYEIAGVASRSLDGARKIESQTGIPAFRDAKQLVDGSKPDLLVVAVSDTANESTVSSLLDLRVPILCETPLSWSSNGVRRLANKAAQKNVPLGVAEQFPYLPLEQFRRTLIAEGIFGDIYTALNNFHSYSYHGIAQFRRYVSGHPSSVSSITCFQPPDVEWQTAFIRFSDGGLLVYNYGLAGPALSPSQPNELIIGTKGSMHGYEISLSNNGKVDRFKVTREEALTGELKRIHVTLPAIGRISWENQFFGYNFSDEQIAIATVIDRMSHVEQNRTAPLYTAADFLIDIEIVQAMRFSSQCGGRSIRFPFNETYEKFRKIAHYRVE